MPNIKSAEKQLRQSLKHRERNRETKSRMKTAVKRVEQAIEAGDPKVVKESLKEAVKTINRTAQKGIVHDNKAARLTSRLTVKANKTLAKAAEKPPAAQQTNA